MTSATRRIRWAVAVGVFASLVGCDRNPLDSLGLPWPANHADSDAKGGGGAAAVGVDAALQFKAQNKNVMSLRIGDFQRRTPGVQPRVHDAFENADVVYEGVVATPIFDSVYGPDWTRASSVVVASLDGRKVTLPAERFRKHKAWLVWRRMDRPGFALSPSGGGGLIEAAPVYLVWDNLNDAVLRDEADMGWVPAVASINMLDADSGISALTLPADASPAALAGLALFKQHCAQCHAINGLGSSGGSELNVPVNVTEYWREPMLAKFIDDPRQVRAGSPMPRLALEIKDRPQAIAQLLAFLREMALHKAPTKP